MDSALAPPTATIVDAASAGLVALGYILVAIAAWLRTPRDGRARVFMIAALLNAGPAATTVVLWQEGAAAVFTKALVLSIALTTVEGALALFHFTQLFPSRRPWITRYARWLAAGYVVLPVLTAGIVLTAPPSIEAVTPAYLALVLFVGVPLGLFAGAFVPLAGLVSLYKSYVTARTSHDESARSTLFWMIVSQAGGGILAAILLPLLHTIAAPLPLMNGLAVLLCLFGLMMPAAYGLGVWRWRLLDRPAAV